MFYLFFFVFPVRGALLAASTVAARPSPPPWPTSLLPASPLRPSAAPAAGSTTIDVSQRLNRRLALRRTFMQLQSRPGDSREPVPRADLVRALAANVGVAAFLSGGALLDRVAVRGSLLMLMLMLMRMVDSWC